MEIIKDKVCGMRNEVNYWYVATVYPPTCKDGTYQGWTPCMTWCHETFGGAPATSLTVGRGWRYVSEGVFEFEHEVDRTAFLLRWQ